MQGNHETHDQLETYKVLKGSVEYNQKEKLGQSNEKKKKERNTFFVKKDLVTFQVRLQVVRKCLKLLENQVYISPNFS